MGNVENSDTSFSDVSSSLYGLLSDSFEHAMSSVFTAIPAIILGVKNNQRELLVDVQPLISMNKRDGTVVDMPSILNVPLQMPASSIGGVLFPVAVGDNVLLVFSMRGVDTWKYGNGTPAAPSDYRRFNMKDCIAIPCVFPVSKSVNQPNRHSGNYQNGDVVVYNNLGTGGHVDVILKKDGSFMVNSNVHVTVNAPDATINANVRINGNVSIVGDSLTHNGVNVGSTHTHKGVQSGNSSTGTPN